MGLISKPNTWSAGQVIVAAQHNSNFDTIYNLVNGNIDTNNLSASANIADTQLTQITTAGKVSGAAVTSLASVPSAAGLLPFANTTLSTVSILTPGATPALDASLGNVFTLAMAGNYTIAVPSNPTSGQKIIIRATSDGTARTLALNTGAGGFRFGTDIITLTQTAINKTDYIGCIYNAAASFWDVVAYSKGF